MPRVLLGRLNPFDTIAGNDDDDDNEVRLHFFLVVDYYVVVVDYFFAIICSLARRLATPQWARNA